MQLAEAVSPTILSRVLSHTTFLKAPLDEIRMAQNSWSDRTRCYTSFSPRRGLIARDFGAEVAVLCGLIRLIIGFIESGFKLATLSSQRPGFLPAALLTAGEANEFNGEGEE